MSTLQFHEIAASQKTLVIINEHFDKSRNIEGNQRIASRWIQGLLAMQKQAGNSLEFLENVKADLFPDEVYVFTPRGEIIELPSGATPIDFAYSVHTELGNSCIACRVDGQLIPLSEMLQSGQKIEIIPFLLRNNFLL